MMLRSGFPLIRIALIAFVACVVASVAVPAWQQRQRTARAQATIAALRQFDATFQRYAHDHGDWPGAATAPGAVPPDMSGTLAQTPWSEAAPIGGRFVWLVNTMERGERVRAAIGIVSVSDSRVSDDKRQLDELMRQAGPGGLNPNRLRLGFRDEPIYILEH